MATGMTTPTTPARSDAGAVIRARGLAKRFRSAGGEVHALNGVDVEVDRGQILVLLGPSGCGKTTLLRCIGGLERPNEGRVWLGGTLVASIGEGVDFPPERRNLGMMFQSYGLWPHMTVFKNIAYPLTNRSGISRTEIAARVNAMLDKMGVGGLGDRYPGQLSGGQQQRVGLARALVASPTALLFDEPLSNVDAQVRKRLREEIRQMKDETGFAGIYVTHDQEEAMALADVLAVMQAGEIRQIGSPWEIYRRPRTLYVANFIGEANALPAQAVSVEGGTIAAETALGRVVLKDEGASAAAAGGQIGKGHVIVRPHDILVSEPGEDAVEGINRFTGKVKSSVLLGPHVELRILIGDNELRAWTHSRTENGFPPGSSVNVEIPMTSATWIAE